MNPLYYQLASAACAGAATALLGATYYYGARLLKYDRDIDDLREVIAAQRQTISAMTLYSDQTRTVPSPPQETEMCGGCGAYLTQEEIATCPGETCSRFAEQSLPLFGDDGTHIVTGNLGTFQPGEERKIPIGYTGHLHTSKKPLV